MQARLDWMAKAMAIRRHTIEHTFGTPKLWMCATRFLTRIRSQNLAEPAYTQRS
jgi:hypothetical protein